MLDLGLPLNLCFLESLDLKKSVFFSQLVNLSPLLLLKREKLVPGIVNFLFEPLDLCFKRVFGHTQLGEMSFELGIFIVEISVLVVSSIDLI